MKKYLQHIPVIFLLAGAALRVAGISASAIWHDEAVTWLRVQMPFLQMNMNFSEQSGDVLLETILRPLVAINHSVWMLRLPALLASIGSLWLVWTITRRFHFNPLQTAISAAIVSFLPGLIWMSQDARSYSLLSLLFLAAILFAIDGRWLGMTASLGLMLYCHNTAPAFILAVAIVAYILHPLSWPKIVACLLIVGLAYIPQVIVIFQNNFQANILAPDKLDFSRTAWAITLGFFGGTIDMRIGLFFLLWITISLILFAPSTDPAFARRILFLAWLIPLLAFFAVSLIQNIIIYRTIFPMLYPFALWLGWELGYRVDFPRVVMSICMAAFLMVGLIHWDPARRGGGLDQVAAQIRQEWRPGDVIVYTTQTVAAPFDYYLDDLPHVYLDQDASNFFLNPPGIKLIRSTADLTTAKREWILIPNDILLTDAEMAALQRMVKYQAPLYTVTYWQSSPLMVYLVEK